MYQVINQTCFKADQNFWVSWTENEYFGLGWGLWDLLERPIVLLKNYVKAQTKPVLKMVKTLKNHWFLFSNIWTTEWRTD